MLPRQTPARYFRDNPVYDFSGMEVTVWNFRETGTRALNLFSDGTISEAYLLATKAPPGFRGGSKRTRQLAPDEKTATE